MYLFFSFIGYFCLALVAILDKFIVSNQKSKPAVYAFYTAIVMLPILLLQFYFGFPFLNNDWLWGLVSGITFGLAMWTLFLAVAEGEASHIGPFNGAMLTLITYLLSNTFLNERLTGLQILGVIILSLACLLLAFEKSKHHSGFHKGFIWAIISGLFFAVSLVSIKYLYLHYEFWPSFIWARGTAGLLGVAMLILPSIRKSFKKVKNQEQKNKQEKKVLVILSNKVLSVVATVLLQYATAIGSVIIVNALGGLQYALMFLLIYISTKFFPKFFKEYFTKRELVMEIMAIILIIIGSALFIV